jgi:hypothetical protein
MILMFLSSSFSCFDVNLQLQSNNATFNKQHIVRVLILAPGQPDGKGKPAGRCGTVILEFWNSGRGSVADLWKPELVTSLAAVVPWRSRAVGEGRKTQAHDGPWREAGSRATGR